jgi:hypothetical protein
MPLVQMPDLIFGLAILTLRKKSNNLVSALTLRKKSNNPVSAERAPTHSGVIIHTLSDAEFAS